MNNHDSNFLGIELSTTPLLPATSQDAGVALRVEDEHVHVVGGQFLCDVVAR